MDVVPPLQDGLDEGVVVRERDVKETTRPEVVVGLGEERACRRDNEGSACAHTLAQLPALVSPQKSCPH
jgi:hypothetical protein